MGLLDMFMPKDRSSGSRGGWGSEPLDSMLERYMQQQRQQQFFGLLSNIGQGIMAANRGGQPPLRAISAGLAQGRPASGHDLGGLLDWMKVRKYGQEQEAEKQYQNLVTGGSGFDPTTGVDWNAPRPGNPDVTRGMTPMQRGLLSSLPREQGLGLLADQAFPKTQQPPTGFARTPAGLEPILGGPADIGYLGRKAEAIQKPTKSTMGDRKLALLNKWRGAQEGRGQWSAADQAEWDMIIQADPMDIMRRNMLRSMAPGSVQAPGGAQAAPRRGEPLAFVTPLGPPDEQPRASSEYGTGSPAQKLQRLSEQRPGKVQAPVTPRSVSPRGPRGYPGRTRQEAKNPPLLPNGGIDRSLLVAGQVYQHPVDGQAYRWTGTEFVSAR